MKTMTVEELLTWAFTHELPKGGGVDGLGNMHSAWRQLEASSWGKVLGFAELLTIIDSGPREPGMWIEQGAPHEDALEAGRAVAALAECDVVFPDGWNPVSDWTGLDGLGRDAVERAVERFSLRPARARRAHVVSLVVSTSVLGKVPDYSAPLPAMRMVERAGRPAWFVKKTVTDAFGRKHDIETDGYDRKRGRPLNGAYRKYELSPDPVGDILGRIDYQIWLAALKRLERTLPQHLVEHRIAFTDRSATPWTEGRDGLGVQLVPAAAGALAEKFSTAC